jgi:hypothetical protein
VSRFSPERHGPVSRYPERQVRVQTPSLTFKNWRTFKVLKFAMARSIT